MSILLAWFLLAAPTPTQPTERPCVVVVVGTPGEPDYGVRFRSWADQWLAAATKGSAETVSIGFGPTEGPSVKTTDRDRLQKALADRSSEGREPLWIVLIGHGTFDGREAKFNLRGPDMTDADLAAWLAPVKRPVVVIDCTAGSAPFLTKLSAANRVIVTATRSGSELNFSRFGGYLAAAIGDAKADLDKDGQVSLLEAFLTANGRVAESYRTRAELATEHALIDDNGDRLGTPAEFFRGVRAVRRATTGAAADGLRAHQLHLIPSDRERALSPNVRRRRDEIERAIAALRDQKEQLPEDDYYARLETLMVELAKIYRGH
jgi:hypothetical protein